MLVSLFHLFQALLQTSVNAHFDLKKNSKKTPILQALNLSENEQEHLALKKSGFDHFPP